MLLSHHRKTFLGAGRLFNKTLPYYRLSQIRQNDENEEEKDSQREKPEGSSFPFFPTLFGSVLAGGIASALYQDFTKCSGTEILESKSEAKLSPAVLDAIKTYGKNSQEVASLLKKEAKISYLLRKWEDSITFYNEAIRIYSIIKSPECEEVAQLNQDLGKSYLKIEKIDKAREAIQKSGDIFLSLGQNEQGFEQLETLALTYRGNFAKCREMFEDIIKQRKEKIGQKDPLLAKTYFRLATLEKTHGMEIEVGYTLNKAYRVMRSQIPNDKLSDINQEISLFYHSFHGCHGASFAQRAIDYLDSEKDAEKIAHLTKKIAIIHSELEARTKSIETFKLYVDRVKNFEGYQLELAFGYRRIAEQCEEMKYYGEAIQYWDKYAEIYRALNEPELCIAGKMLQCSLYLKEYRQKRGVNCFEDAFMWASRDLGEEHELTKEVFENLQACKKG